LDVPGALEARSYLGSGTIILELEDEMLAQNHGRWRIEASDGRASVEKTSESADARLHIKDLAATYLGAFSLCDLVAAGRATELRSGAAEDFDNMFRTLVSPYCPEIF
ncbi:MAG: sterol carrier protein domain-containing protein, partial [Actinobacteria bacterium]|nr:sterol carrier protein domain-containing protein [Actinomycetota bacterium]